MTTFITMPDTTTTIGTYEVNGQQAVVSVGRMGNFTLAVGDVEGRGPSLDDARKDLRLRLNRLKARVAIEFRAGVNGDRYTATGIHSGNNNVIVKRGSKTDYWNFSSRVWKGDTPDDVVVKYRDLNRQILVLRRQQQELEGQYQIGLGFTVREAIEKAARTATATVDE